LGFLHQLEEILQQELQRIRDETGEDMAGLIKFFVDDGNLAAPHAVMRVLLQHIKDHGRDFGFIINPNKGHYLLGKCDSWILAEQRRAALVADGFNDAIIKTHPADCADEAEVPALRAAYGVKMLGAYVGDDEYVLAGLRKRLDEFAGRQGQDHCVSGLAGSLAAL
jgi:hypothetical protein